MTTKQAIVTAKLVDDDVSMATCIQQLVTAVDHSTTVILFIDLEGINLCRHGTVSLLSLLIHDGSDNADAIFLIDITTLGYRAFVTPSATFQSSSRNSLQEILEDPSIQKVFFDVRNDADALHHKYAIRLQGIIDLQLMENAMRVGSGQSYRLLHGLAKCIRKDSNLSMQEKTEFQIAKERGQRLFCPEKGGSFDVFKLRPLNQDIILYCEQDIKHLPDLYHKYSKRLEESSFVNWYVRIIRETENRIENAESFNYEPHGSHKVFGPAWARDYVNRRDEVSESYAYETYDEYNDTARDSEGWEDDMVQNGD